MSAYIAKVYLGLGVFNYIDDWFDFANDIHVTKNIDLDVALAANFKSYNSIQAGFEVTTAEAASYFDGDSNKIITKEKVSGKGSFVCTAAEWHILQQHNKNIDIITRTNREGEYIRNVRPYFAETAKIGDVRIINLTFEFEQSASKTTEEARRILFSITKIQSGAS